MKSLPFVFMGERSTYWNLYFGWGILVGVLLLTLAGILWILSDVTTLRPRSSRGEISVAELCRRKGIHPTIYYKWLKDFMEAGKAHMRGDTVREATSDEVKALRRENERLKQLVADLSVANLLLKKSQS